MDEAAKVDLIARTIKDATRSFSMPVRYYIEPEADSRWEEENPDADWSGRPKFDELESYRIIAREIIRALANDYRFIATQA